MEGKIVKTLTLQPQTIEFVTRQGKLENRTFSNMIDSIVQRYEKICEEALPLGLKIDIASPK